ncbi:tape measure protein [bacterium]|nr:tape measure protein [bacterium]
MAEKKFIIEVRTKGFARATKDIKDLDTNSKKYNRTADKMRGQSKGLIANLGSLRNKILVYSFALGGAVAVMNKFVQAASGFQDVKTRLVGLTGSTEAAKEAFETFNQVAATTPFALQDVVNAGAQLEAFGVDSEATLGAVTDLAAFMGTTATEAASSLGRAFAGGAGAADILRERGILQLIKDSQGIQDLSKITLPEFRRALISAMVDPVAGIQGSSDRLSKTFTGAVSNMNDAVTRFAASIGNIMLPSLTKAANSIETFFRELNVQRLAQITTAITAMATAFVLVNNRAIIFKATVGLLTLNLKSLGIALGAAVLAFGLDKYLQAQNAFSSLNTATKTLSNSTAQLAQKQQQYIGSLQTTTINLGISADAQKRINEIMAETVLLTMQNNDVDEKRIKIAQMIFQAEANLSDALKGKVKIDRELATQGIFSMSTTEQLTEAENQEFLAIDRNIAAKMDSIMAGKELITTNTSLASGINTVASSMRSLKDGTLDGNQAFGLFLKTAGALVSAANPLAGAVLSLGSSFVGHTGGLIKQNGIQRFAQGGQVQGEDNVPILAQAGEFIMKRSAVQNIGVQNLANMNRTGNAGGVTINISGNMIGNDEFVRDNLIPEIQKVSNQGLA